MLSNPGVGGANDLLELLEPEIRESLESSRKILDEAAWLRASAGRHDTPLDECERSLREGPPRGRKLRGALAHCSEAVVEANEIHRQVLAKESEALPLFREAVEGIAGLAEENDAIPSTALDLLKECTELRAEAIEWRERALRAPGGVLDVGAKGTADQLLALLEERRRLLGEARTRERKAEQLERRAIRFPEGAAAEPEASKEALPPEPAPDPAPPGKAAPRTEGLRPGQGLLKKIADLEAELSVALRRAEADRAEVARSSEERIRRIEGLHDSSLAREKEARSAAEKAFADIEESHLEATVRLEEVEGEMERLLERLSETEETARAERSAHDAESSLARDRIEWLEERRDFLKRRVISAMRQQVGVSRDAVEESASLRTRLAEAEDSAKTDHAAVEEERKAAEGKLTEMKACLEELERRVDDLKSNEEEIARERDQALEKLTDAERRATDAGEQLAKESADSKVAQQERNEALALASSLIRRLESDGVPAEEVAPAKTIAKELGQVRREMGSQQSELESIKAQLDAYKKDLSAQIDKLRKSH